MILFTINSHVFVVSNCVTIFLAKEGRKGEVAITCYKFYCFKRIR